MSLVVASEDNTSDQNGKPSTPPHLTSSTSTIITARQNLHLTIILVLRMYYLPRECAPKGSAEQFTDPFLVVWPAHNLLITLPALPTTILFWFEQTLHLFHFTLHNFKFQHAYLCSFSMIYLPFLHPSVLQKVQPSDLPTQF